MDCAESSQRATVRDVLQNLRNRKFVLLLNQIDAELRVDEDRPHQNRSEHHGGSRGSSIKDTREGYVAGEEAIYGILSAKGCSLVQERKALLLLNKAYCEHQLGLMRRALKTTEKALDLVPASLEAQILRIKILIGLRHFEKAKEYLQSLCNLPIQLESSFQTLSEIGDLVELLEGRDIKSDSKYSLTSRFRKLMLEAESQGSEKQSHKNLKDASLQTEDLELLISPDISANRISQVSERNVSQGISRFKATCSIEAECASPSVRNGSDGCSDHCENTMEVSGPFALQKKIASQNPISAVSLAVQLVNSGKYMDAISLLNETLERHGKKNVGALATRGTALALIGDIRSAINDFSAAIELQPRYADFYKRRAQALAALGENEDALHDIAEALQLLQHQGNKNSNILCEDNTNSCNQNIVELLLDSARIHQKRHDYMRAEVAVRKALGYCPQDIIPLLVILGSAQLSQGNLNDAIITYEKLIELDSSNSDAFLNFGMALKESNEVDKSAEMLAHAATLGAGSSVEINARRVLAQLKQGLGNHSEAIKHLDIAIMKSKSINEIIELRFLRGACYHAIGCYRQAVEDYQWSLDIDVDKTLSKETLSYICLSFYQREIVFWIVNNLDSPMRELCLDADLLPEFKELWCKKCPPNTSFVSKYQEIVRSRSIRWKSPRLLDISNEESLNRILMAADRIGSKIQYCHQGFLSNRRQHRMAGLAAIEVSQLLRLAASHRNSGKALEIPDVGSSICARGDSGIGGGGHGVRGSQHRLGWRDAMEVIVKWRQIAEPNDQVLWVDLLTKEEFSEGFGSHTPIYTGQTKCVRYYMNFNRALQLAKGIILSQGYVCNVKNRVVKIDSPDQKRLIQEADSAMKLWQSVGQGFWVCVPIESSRRPGHTLEGTRLTCVSLEKSSDEDIDLQSKFRSIDESNKEDELSMQDGQNSSKLEMTHGTRHEDPDEYKNLGSFTVQKPPSQPNSFEFSIRTPVTPDRWEQYDEELSTLFDNLIEALSKCDEKEAIDTTLRFAYYWYNFMPLARGSAVCGYILILGSFLAMGKEIQASIPEHYQVDWEAILRSSPKDFFHSVSQWITEGAENTDRKAPNISDLPEISERLRTLRDRIMALNGFQGGAVG